MAMRDSEDGEFDADTGEMLGYLHFDDDGAMTFADFDGAWKYFYHDCDEATARWAFDRLGPERFGGHHGDAGVGAQFWAADLPRASSCASRTGRCRAGWPTPWRGASGCDS
jgi:hypothetical protein